MKKRMRIVSALLAGTMMLSTMLVGRGDKDNEKNVTNESTQQSEVKQSEAQTEEIEELEPVHLVLYMNNGGTDADLVAEAVNELEAVEALNEIKEKYYI